MFYIDKKLLFIYFLNVDSEKGFVNATFEKHE